MRAVIRRVTALLGPTGRVRFARARAIAWGVLGVVSVPLGWANSVALVWFASVYANVASEMATGEAADDTKITDRLDRLETGQRRIEADQKEILRLLSDRRLS